MIHLRRLGFAVLLTLGTTGAAPVTGPSFDCTKATAAVEQAICGDPDLARLDLEMAHAYEQARSVLDPGSAEHLRADQALFLKIRNSVFERDRDGLAARLRERRAFLEKVRTVPADDLSGRWENAIGTVTVTRKGGGTLEVSISSVEPISAGWICNLEGGGRWEGATLVVDSAPTTDPWSVRLSRRGQALVVEEVVPSPGEQHPMCGASGFFAGVYFPVTET